MARGVLQMGQCAGSMVRELPLCEGKPCDGDALHVGMRRERSVEAIV